MPLTVLIPCKNEAHNLRDCVASVRGLADEILVADSLSSDSTVAVARELGCRVIEREFIGYADFKNWAIPQCRHDWVLIVDADERIEPDLAAAIREVLAGSGPADDVDAFAFRRRNFFMDQEVRHTTWGTHEVVRLFRRDRIRYQMVRVHENLVVDPQRVRKLAGSMKHYSFTSYEQYLSKCAKYAELLAQESFARGRRATWYGLTIKPLLKFFQTYILQGGILDGSAGLQVAVLTAVFGTYLKYARLWELQRKQAAQHLAGSDQAVEQRQQNQAA